MSIVLQMQLYSVCNESEIMFRIGKKTLMNACCAYLGCCGIICDW